MKWKWPLVTRSRYDDLNADRERIRGERNQFLKDRKTAQAATRTAERKVAEADATNRRLEGRLLELSRRNSALTESDPDHCATLEQQVARLEAELAEACARLAKSMDVEGALAKQIHDMAQPVDLTDAELDEINQLIRERDAEKKRADRLQQQMDTFLGLDQPAVVAGETWQDRREQKMRYDA